MDDAFRKSATRIAGSLAAAALLAACSGPLDYDMRGRMGGTLDTSQAALSASTADKPVPDARGVLSYPTYQVAVARNGDTVATVANRVGLAAGEVARYNGMQANDPMRAGEILALPSRVGVAVPSSSVDITTLAGNAINNAPATARPSEVTSSTLAPAQTSSAAQTGGVEPIRHKVQRGETAYTVARLYGVTPKSLAEWNGLDSNFTLREGQYLMIPVVEQRATRAETVTVSPGSGSPTPQPPSSVQPLPQDEPSKAAQTTTAAAKPVADIGQASSNALMAMPVNGSIVREYSKGKNEGIDISAPAGSAVKAAASGTVAAITRNTENVQIVVIRHPDELLSIYTHLDGLQVKKGDAVSRGQTIGSVRAADPAFLHFEVRKGFESVDPMGYLR
ncbi:M23 family metallopeptidase [Alloyangia pacifica]|uniref:Murein DD-endopeptidase MepM and murein hydrolase activator NlpD, contain LysM domain n=1 Tax=Alloyangia pacifica TaxID=311180 RepID=A0A1I6VQ22_9RHOB|nr:M23 family metallopeptidase [Alloyangia pacifica]SDI08087.1 Murein DD-endopeptidase MepM and murein hydrolase activator NlpD, contain LysM domain [Alloyangia pacifica]SFT15524.1 Murein DD-endopeptidase MepM and murein hydrolase activator NlpD, contain LysM domain [Alloyangia pacifica]